MKKLERRFKKQRNTVETYVCCGCPAGGVCCPCAYCAATWYSQHVADTNRTMQNDHNYDFSVSTC